MLCVLVCVLRSGCMLLKASYSHFLRPSDDLNCLMRFSNMCLISFLVCSCTALQGEEGVVGEELRSAVKRMRENAYRQELEAKIAAEGSGAIVGANPAVS